MPPRSDDVLQVGFAARVVEEDVAGRTFEEIGVGVEHAGTVDRALPQVFLELFHGGMMASGVRYVS